VRYRLFGIVAAIALAADQLSKLWARAALPVDQRGNGIPITVIEGYWDWVLEYNTGSAFSLISGGSAARIILAIIAAVALGVIGYLVRSARDDQRGLVLALGLMAGGAVGNLIDRIALGRVTDFVLWHVGDVYWPVFNVADVCLVVAVPLFLFFGYRAGEARSLERRDTTPVGE
jgi:signal peptidase II